MFGLVDFLFVFDQWFDDDDGVFVAVDGDVDDGLPLVDVPDGEEDPEREVGGQR